MAANKKRAKATTADAVAPIEAPYVRRISGGALLVLVILLGLTHIRDSDTWWHLKTGELIWHNGIPRFDPFSYVLDGRPWVAFEWLSQALFFLLFKFGGAAGLTAFKATLLGATFMALWRLERDRSLWSAVVLSAAALAMREHFVERPFLFDYFFLACMAFSLWNVHFSDPPRRLLWLFPLLGALWANLHGGAAALVPILLVVAMAAERLRDARVPLGRWSAIVALSGLALFVNPHGAGILSQLWDTLNFPGKEFLFEWHSPTSRRFLGLYGLFLVVGLPACAFAFRRKPFIAAWAAVAAAASMRMERNIPLYLLLVAPTIICVHVPRPLRAPRPWVCATTLLGLFLAAWAHTNAHAYLWERFGLGTEEPLAGAVSFLKQANLAGRMFNEYESGGYLIWKLCPDRKVFIDGRNTEYDPRTLRLALAWYRPEAWRMLDGMWRFDYAVISRHITGAYTARVLEDSPEWRAAYWDDTAMVYLRRTPANEILIRRFGYELLKPGRANAQYLEPLLSDPRLARVLLAELDRSVKETRSSCVNALLLKAYVLVHLGRMKEGVAAAQSATERHPDRTQPWFTLGWVRAAAGDLPGAERAYVEALRLVRAEQRATLGADILNDLGLVREKMGRPREAREDYRGSLRWNPGQGDALANFRRLQ